MKRQHIKIYKTELKQCRGKFIVLNAYIQKEETSQINHVNPHFKNIEKEEENKPTEAEGRK